MVFKKFTFVILLFLSLPVFIFAQQKDYLYVSLRYDFDTGKITILSIEQRVLDSSQVLISNSGDFELLLTDKKGQVVSRNTFTMPIDEEIEVLLEDGRAVYTKTDSYSTTVALPLEQSIDVEDLTFQVKKDGQIIFSEKFSTDTFTILDVKENTIRLPEPPAPKERRYLPWLITGLSAFIIWFIWRWRMIRKRASESDYMMMR